MNEDQASLLREAARKLAAAVCFLVGQSREKTMDEIDEMFADMEDMLAEIPNDFAAWRQAMVDVCDKCKRIILTTPK